MKSWEGWGIFVLLPGFIRILALGIEAFVQEEKLRYTSRRHH